MDGFTPVSGFLGGLMIGAAAALLILANGRVAGISGILGGLLDGASDRLWRALFLGGLVVGPLVALALGFGPSEITVTGSIPLLIIGGLLVGIGTRVGGGCTSGHGVCGLARLSRRSLVATVVFMGCAAATVFAARHVLGGA